MIDDATRDNLTALLVALFDGTSGLENPLAALVENRSSLAHIDGEQSRHLGYQERDQSRSRSVRVLLSARECRTRVHQKKMHGESRGEDALSTRTGKAKAYIAFRTILAGGQAAVPRLAQQLATLIVGQRPYRNGQDSVAGGRLCVHPPLVAGPPGSKYFFCCFTLER